MTSLLSTIYNLALMLSFTNLLQSTQIKDSDISQLIDLAERFRQQDRKKTLENSNCKGLILATLFFESSTRTRFSFESAMYRLGGNVITLEQGDSSSIKKGESLSDTGRIMSNYADLIVVRHPEIGSVAELAKYATVPVINAGDGANQHPTQSLADLYTIFCEKGRLDNLKIAVVGDLKYSRTVHSLLDLMSRHSNNHFTLISHPSLTLDATKKRVYENNGCKITETSNLNEAVIDADIIYVTRIQEERFTNKKDYELVRDIYRINKKTLAQTKADLTIMHPLPRINEIDVELDDMQQARYFAQANYGMYIRMALISLLVKN